MPLSPTSSRFLWLIANKNSLTKYSEVCDKPLLTPISSSMVFNSGVMFKSGRRAGDSSVRCNASANRCSFTLLTHLCDVQSLGVDVIVIGTRDVVENLSEGRLEAAAGEGRAGWNGAAACSDATAVARSPPLARRACWASVSAYPNERRSKASSAACSCSSGVDIAAESPGWLNVQPSNRHSPSSCQNEQMSCATGAVVCFMCMYLHASKHELFVLVHFNNNL